MRSLSACIALAVAALAAATACSRPDPTLPAAPAAAAADPVTIHFDDLPIGQAPAGFLCASPGPAEARPARWEVLAAPDAPSPTNVLQQSDDDDTNHRYPVALWQGLRIADVRVSAHARAISGGRDRSFGVVVRASDPRSYYVARANTSGWGENIRLYLMLDGKRTELAEWEGPVERDAWHELSLEAVGDRLRVLLDGRQLIEHHDSAIAGPGMCGVWTKAEAVSRFDDLTITPVQP
jgi:hypothetical protein